jgi:hypothetical protein
MITVTVMMGRTPEKQGQDPESLSFSLNPQVIRYSSHGHRDCRHWA